MIDLLKFTAITGGFSYLLYSSIQPRMLFDYWLYFWSKKVLDWKGIDWSEQTNDECVEIAKIYKIMKPLGTCIKCFSVWASLPMSIYFSQSITDFLFIFITSIIYSTWLAVME